MGNLTGRIPTRGKEYGQDDGNEYRKRVATYVDGSVVSYEDTSFVTGDSPSVLDVSTDLGRTAHVGYFSNDGPGDIKVEISANGTAYGGQHTLRGGDILNFDNLAIKKIRLTWVDNTEYRVLIG